MSVIKIDNVYKDYQLYNNDYQRFLEIITGKSKAKIISALKPVSLDIYQGEIVGLIGNNGAGKSTLLKLITGTTTPSGGSIKTRGRIAALLELGAGFHPDLTGHENIYLSGSILGISKAQMDQHYDEIVEFSGIGDFIHQPVKTYSSGMFVRLAFSVATSVDPDILIIDEALSVGDGRFARKSFDRIMSFKENGKTIIFCSHAMFHIEQICNRTIWIDKGEMVMDDKPSVVVSAYNNFIKTEQKKVKKDQPQNNSSMTFTSNKADNPTRVALANLNSIEVKVDGEKNRPLIIQSGQSELSITVTFESDEQISLPQIGVMISDELDHAVTSACTLVDGFSIERNEAGLSKTTLTFPQVALLKGKYYINIYLMCEKCILVYDQAVRFDSLEVTQQTLEMGLVRLPHKWRTTAIR